MKRFQIVIIGFEVTPLAPVSEEEGFASGLRRAPQLTVDECIDTRNPVLVHIWLASEVKTINHAKWASFRAGNRIGIVLLLRRLAGLEHASAPRGKESEEAALRVLIAPLLAQAGVGHVVELNQGETIVLLAFFKAAISCRLHLSERVGVG
ncbi:UNVERIFIED_CONTAM: hypothetical protein HHA_456280 [Hammondia hammondi]|eukprot:XP_008888950.1 hypothetical protein HHA_456280 [Hammondia hammondi]